jgi:hypothetical protein
MALLDTPSAYGDTIFCDDIRHEVGGKASYIGVYRTNLYINGTFPFTLPLFGFGVSYYQRATDYVAPTKILIFFPGETEEGSASIVAEIDPNWLKSAELLAKENGASNPEGRIVLVANLHFGAIAIKEPGLLRVRVDRGNDLIKLGALKIDVHPSFAAQQEAKK